jgi:predicted amidohydrolase YtcJ
MVPDEAIRALDRRPDLPEDAIGGKQCDPRSASIESRWSVNRALWIVVGIVVVLAALAYWKLSPPRPPASQVFVGGPILTMDGEDRVAEAVAIEGERIVAVGSRADVESWIEAGAIVHDLAGQTLIPGFVDAHGHFPGSGLRVVGVDLNSPPIGKTRSIAGLTTRLQKKAAETPAGEWIFGFGYDDTLLAEKRHPSREDLDAASSTHPIFLTHVSGHLAVANSLALEEVGFDEDTLDPDGGAIGRDAETGRLTGLLEENATTPFQAKAMDFSVWDFLAMVRDASAEYASVGVTTAQSGAVDSRLAQGLRLASRLGLVPFRLELWPVFDELGPKLLDGSVDADDWTTDLVRLGAIKIIADGSIQGYTGYLSEPYHVPFHGDASYRGYPRVGREELVDWVMKYHAAGLQMAIHGNGDASIDDIIHAFREAQQAHPREDPRLIVIHAQMARDDQLDAMKELGMTPSFFSAHTYYWGDRHAAIFMGPERAARMSPARSALDRDLRFSVHLDTPVTPMRPLLGVWATMNRLSTGGNVIGEAQRIDPMPALRAATIDAAWQIFREDEIGSIEVGKLADLVVLDGNPIEEPARIRDLEVQRTVVGGVTIFAREATSEESEASEVSGDRPDV